MKKIINFFLNKKDIIKKIFFTLFIIFVYVGGSNIYIPFLPVRKYELIISHQKLPFLFGFLGEHFNTLCLLSLGVMPYITSSIFVQIMQKFFLPLKEWSEQGEKGKYKTSIFTRILTFFFAIAQSLALILNSKVFYPQDDWFLILQTLFFLIVGAFICIWLSDLITSKGIGNGVSLLLVLSISKEVFNLFKFLIKGDGSMYIADRIIILFLFLLLLILTVILSSSYLNIPIHYTTKVNNDNKIERNIPIKVNVVGVLPIILANTLLNVIPIFSVFFNKDSFFNKFAKLFVESRHYLGIGFFIYLLLIILFSFFTVFMIIQPNEIAESLSKQDAFLESVKPGKETVYKITYELFRVTIVGTILLTLLSASPDLIGYFFSIPKNFKFGGTSLLIIVGVVFDFIQRITSKTNIQQMYDKLF
uniref:Protein translocase subunit SecY n=1 Tax=Candidatus Phytoplasma palmae TaxID=85624 RepID=A0A9E9FUY1_9MOLU|nr:SecY [16SrIV (Coconut lethal yellows group)]